MVSASVFFFSVSSYLSEMISENGPRVIFAGRCQSTSVDGIQL